jgi:hypothetical protein
MPVIRRAALVAALGSPCPWCGEPMDLQGRPPTRNHVAAVWAPPRRPGWQC